jgi:hypothetical protein
MTTMCNCGLLFAFGSYFVKAKAKRWTMEEKGDELQFQADGWTDLLSILPKQTFCDGDK